MRGNKPHSHGASVIKIEYVAAKTKRTLASRKHRLETDNVLAVFNEAQKHTEGAEADINTVEVK